MQYLTIAAVTPPTTPADQIAQLKADLRDAESRYLGLQVTLRATSSRYQAELADIKAKHAEAMQDIRGEIEDVCKGMEENFEADLNLWALEREALVTKLKEYGWEETDGINGVVSAFGLSIVAIRSRAYLSGGDDRGRGRSLLATTRGSG